MPRNVVPIADATDISVVLPTFERAAALPTALGDLLALDGVGEVVVVDDASSDETPAVLAAVDDPRLRIVRHERNRGSAAARNTGGLVARGAWVLHADDDDRFPADYATVLRDEALAHDAAIAGAPWLLVDPGHALEDVLARARADTRLPRLDVVTAFPPRTVETPWVPARALMRREAFTALRFDEGFRGNAYREETDLSVRAVRAGLRCVLTGRTFSWQEAQHAGGNRRPRLNYEWWTLRNNWRFLRRHESWLRERGEIRSAAGAQARFAGVRAREVVTGFAGARLEELRGR